MKDTAYLSVNPTVERNLPRRGTNKTQSRRTRVCSKSESGQRVKAVNGCAILKNFRRSKECIVYSVGSNNDFRFEEAILKNISSSCDVHVFDHTVTNPTNIPQGVRFHPWGLAAASDTSNAMFTLHDILERLGHVGKVIYIFKIDREGCEWTTYPTWLDSENGVLIDEILVEVHAGTTAPRENPIARQFMQTLYDHNFLIFHKEPNVQYTSGDGLCVEYAFKQVSDTEIKGDAAAVHEK